MTSVEASDTSPPLAGPAESSEKTAAARSNLFGRGMLYVVIWSLQTFAAVIVSPVLAHVMGPAEFGRLASAIALHQVLGVVAVLGIDQALVLQRADDDNNRAARGLIAVALVLASVVTLIAWVTTPFWSEQLGYSGSSSLVLATVVWTGPGAMVWVILALLVSEDRLRSFAVVSVVSAVGGQVCGTILIFTLQRDAGTYIWGGVISEFAAMTVGLIATQPRIAGLIDKQVAWRAVKLGLPLAVSGLSYFVLNAGDRIIIQRMLGIAEVGRYQVAYTVGYVVVLMLTFTSRAWAPRFAAARDEVQRLALIGSSRDEIYRLLLPMTLGITLIAPLALRIVAPASFRPNSLLIVVFLVALAGFPVGAAAASSRALIILRRGRTLAVIAITAAGVNIALNIVLIPHMGIAGSALATVLAYSLQAFLQLRVLPSTPAWPRPSLRLWVSIGATCELSEISVLLPQSTAWCIFRALLAALICLPWFVLRLRHAGRGEAYRPRRRAARRLRT